MRVVIGGSRHLSVIPEEVGLKIQDLMNSNAEFLVGDAPGSDWAFQMYLKKVGYKIVSVFTSAEDIRHNVGNWPYTKIESGLKSKSSAVHAFKDRHMTKFAELGIMIWDGESAGTLSNIIDLINQGKECYLYFGPQQEFYMIDSQSSLNRSLVDYPEVFEEAHKRLDTFKSREKKRAAESNLADTLF